VKQAPSVSVSGSVTPGNCNLNQATVEEKHGSAHQMNMNMTRQGSTMDFDQHCRHVFLFNSPYLYSKLMQLLLLCNCFYLAFYFSNFIRLVWTSMAPGNSRTLALVLCPVPSVVVMCVLSPLIIRNYSTLCAVAELNVECLSEVLKATAQYRKLHALDNLQDCVDELSMDTRQTLEVIGDLTVNGKPLRELLAKVVDSADMDAFALDADSSIPSNANEDEHGQVGRSSDGVTALALDPSENGSPSRSPTPMLSRDHSLKHIQKFSPGLFLKLKEQQEDRTVSRKGPRGSARSASSMARQASSAAFALSPRKRSALLRPIS